MPPLPTPPPPPAAPDVGLDAQRCYQAMADKDAAWDGLFFTGVTSTGIYCRPVCRVKLPRQANCRFFETAALAEAHGFRPCLRCRPELAPARRFWSTTDAQAVLAESAAQQLQSAIQQGHKPPSMAALAAQLGVSDRHLRRVFLRHWQVSPLQYLQTQRLLHAKQWLQDSPLSVAHVARASGFGSARRLYAAFAQHYQLSPGQLRPANAPLRKASETCTELVLHYRPPCQIATLWQFLKDRSLCGMESWEGQGPQAVLRRTLRWPHASHAITGWLALRWDRTQPVVHLRVSASLEPVLPQVVARVRDWLDLDAEPARIAQIIGRDFPHALGQRLPGCLDGFELAVRAILGQQISVKAARTLGQRLVNTLGEPCITPWPELNRTFPSPATLAREENAARMGSLGLVRQRQKAIQALARAVESGSLDLGQHAKLEPTLQALMALPGIGPWTAHYICMRALRWADAWPVQDVALQTALGVRQHPRPTQTLEALGQAWRPCRSYALIAAWQCLAPQTETIRPPRASRPNCPHTMTPILTQSYNSPLGPMILAASDLGLCGVWFEGQRHGPSDERLRGWTSVTAHPLLHDASAQLQAYFAGDLSRFDLPLDLSAGTAFQQSVWQALLAVPSGHSQSYGDLARRMNNPKAVRAVGAAVGRNPVSIIVPCHRILGGGGQLTGYAGGLWRNRRCSNWKATRSP